MAHLPIAVAAEVIAMVDAADSAAEEFNAEEEDSGDDKVAIEVEATVEESCVELVMVMMRTTMWPAVVVRREEVEDDRPSTLPLRKVTVNLFSKGERIVFERDISPYPPALESSNRKPKDWKNAMKMAELAAENF